MTFRRREFLRTLTGGAAALTLSRATTAQGVPSSTKLTDQLTLITGSGNNIIALAGDSGSLLVDCGDAGHASDVCARKRSDRRRWLRRARYSG